MPPTAKRTYLPLSQAASFILDSDLLAFRGAGCLARWIQRGGRGEHSHVAKAVRRGGQFYCAEVREWYGARITPLEAQVRRYPGVIDVYRAASHRRYPEYNSHAASHYLMHLAERSYGYGAVLRASIAHLPVTSTLLEWFGYGAWVRPSFDDEAVPTSPPFCSVAVAMADRIGGGVDPVHRLADAWVEPSDLVRSDFYEAYVCTLMPSTWRAKSPRTGELFFETARQNARRSLHPKGTVFA